jgi:HlyD family secretion protein
MGTTPSKPEIELATGTTHPVVVGSGFVPVIGPPAGAPAAAAVPITPAVVPPTPFSPGAKVAPEHTPPAPSTPTARVAPATQAVPVTPAAESAPAPATKSDHPSSHRGGYRNTIIFSLSIIGVVAALVAAYLFGLERKAQSPVFTPVSSPYDSAIYANGIVESDQASGANVNIFPEVSGPITQVLAHEGKRVSAGTVLFTIDDSVQKANTEQLRLQSEASLALLEELKAQPRKETLAIAKAQVDLAQSNLKAAQDQYDKRRTSYDLNPKSISKDVLDTADNAAKQAASALDVARTQLDLTAAGAWSYDIANQKKQYEALQQTYQAARALLQKYSVKASGDGIVLTINVAVGSYVSSQGAYDTYTQGFAPLVVMGSAQKSLAVRCYVDEILVSRLPSSGHIRAQMSLRGTDVKIPLEFVRVQPYVSPKIELSNQRQEQVDLRVLPVIFRFKKDKDATVYPGQLVDVFIGQK